MLITAKISGPISSKLGILIRTDGEAIRFLLIWSFSVVNTFRIILYRMLPPSRPFLPSLSFSLSAELAVAGLFDICRDVTSSRGTQTSLDIFHNTLPIYAGLISDTLKSASAIWINNNMKQQSDMFEWTGFIFHQNIHSDTVLFFFLFTYCLYTALTLTERFDVITLCSIDRKKKLPVWIQKIFIRKLSFFDKWK